MSDQAPPLALRLLSRRLPEEWRDFVLGDLEEEFRLRAAVSRAAARRWLWRQVLRCMVAPPPRVASYPVPRGDSFMRTLLADARHALRVFVRTPTYALAVAGVLALGIGANTAIYVQPA